MAWAKNTPRGNMTAMKRRHLKKHLLCKKHANFWSKFKSLAGKCAWSIAKALLPPGLPPGERHTAVSCPEAKANCGPMPCVSITCSDPWAMTAIVRHGHYLHILKWMCSINIAPALPVLPMQNLFLYQIHKITVKSLPWWQAEAKQQGLFPTIINDKNVSTEGCSLYFAEQLEVAKPTAWLQWTPPWLAIEAKQKSNLRRTGGNRENHQQNIRFSDDKTLRTQQTTICSNHLKTGTGDIAPTTPGINKNLTK